MSHKDPEKAREYNRRWREENPGYHRRYYERNKERHSANVRRWHKENRSSVRAAQLKTKYGISIADYDAALIAQSGRCAICVDASPKLVVDHCHMTNDFRGLICWSCNVGLGHFSDDPARLAAAIRYLEKL
jgi:hypothetical protein